MEFWIHIVIFTVVFLVTGIILSGRKKSHSNPEDQFSRKHRIAGEVRRIDNLKRKETKKR